MTVRTYDSPAAFKEALEHRLRARTPRGTIVARTRQLLVFERFLARVAAVFGDAATIKGGVALELRIHRARTTKDVDLRLRSRAFVVEYADARARWRDGAAAVFPPSTYWLQRFASVSILET